MGHMIFWVNLERSLSRIIGIGLSYRHLLQEFHLLRYMYVVYSHQWLYLFFDILGI